MYTCTLPCSMRRLAYLLTLALVAGLWLTPLTFAQGRMGDPEQMKQRMEARTDTLVKHLDLTADQEEPVRAILTEHNTKQIELRNKARESGSFGSMREDMGKLVEETETKLSGVLSEKQMTAYKQFIEDQRNRPGRRRGM